MLTVANFTVFFFFFFFLNNVGLIHIQNELKHRVHFHLLVLNLYQFSLVGIEHISFHLLVLNLYQTNLALKTDVYQHLSISRGKIVIIKSLSSTS